MVHIVAIAFRTTLVTLALTGLAYPLLMTPLAQALFPRQAEGSLVRGAAGEVIGSALIGQAFSIPGYFHGRPSAAGAAGYDAAASSGSNLGPTSLTLRERVKAEIARLRRDNPAAPGPIPAELVAASASGLDPHVSPAAALWQAPRVAAARGLPLERVRELVASHVEPRDLGFLGEPRVNVLALNRALDALSPRSAGGL